MRLLSINHNDFWSTNSSYEKQLRERQKHLQLEEISIKAKEKRKKQKEDSIIEKMQNTWNEIENAYR